MNAAYGGQLAISSGTHFGHYEIVSPIGAGGMGEVYRATDTKLGRDVAIKTLPGTLAEDSERLARFEREAKLLAALNHANIAAIFGLDESDGVSFIAMELVEGETLEQRLRRGALPLDATLQIALQIAEALEAAHARGVVHRDLKPANVVITPDGVVKVLDFGLAKAFSGDPNEASPAHSPALSAAMTQAGLILGTAGYMSPEQASGQATDQRADIWAFGVVLYEMLTGMPLFSGESVPHILADVLRSDPDWSRLPKNLNRRIKLLLERCLEKKVRDRYHSIADARVDIEKVLKDPQGVEPVALESTGRSIALPVVAAALVAAVIAVLATRTLEPSPEPEPVMRFSIILEDGQLFNEEENRVVDISRDGAQIVYAADNQLWVRSLNELLARPVQGIEPEERPAYPTFSPDGQSILYLSDRDLQLRRISVVGGTPITLTDALGDDPQGVYWDESDTIYFVGADSNIMSISANGGIPELIIESEEGEELDGARLLPGGEWLLFSVTTGSGADRWDQGDIVAQSLQTGERRVLWRGGSDAHYVRTGHLMYALNDSLFALPFDLDEIAVTGGPTPVVAGVQRSIDSSTDSATANYAFSDDGALVYVPGVGIGVGGALGLAWVNLVGDVEPLDITPRAFFVPRLSPVGRLAALDARDDQNDIHVWNFADETLMRLTFDAEAETAPVWTADSERIAYRRDSEIFWKASNNTGTATRIVSRSGPDVGGAPIPHFFSPDGNDLVFSDFASPSNRDLFIVSADGSGEARRLWGSDFSESNAVLSPDGRWIAYQSDESGTLQVYVRPFPNVDEGVWQITNNGGAYPVWSPATDELFFMTANPMPMMMVAQYTADDGFETAGRRTLFEFDGSVACCPTERPFDISPEGDRFLVITYANRQEGAPTRQINVVLNWFEELERLAPTN